MPLIPDTESEPNNRNGNVRLGKDYEVSMVRIKLTGLAMATVHMRTFWVKNMKGSVYCTLSGHVGSGSGMFTNQSYIGQRSLATECSSQLLSPSRRFCELSNSPHVAPFLVSIYQTESHCF